MRQNIVIVAASVIAVLLFAWVGLASAAVITVDDSGGREDQSDSTFSLTCTPPSAPALNDPGTTDTGGSYTVSWSSVSGATNYTLEEDTSGSFGSPTVVYSGSGTSTQITDRADGTYYYRVNACNACGCGGWSNVADIEILTGGKEVCRNLPSESQIAGDIITVSLDVAVGSATYYLVDEVIPTGWTVVSASGGGDYTADAGHVKWFVISGVTDTSLTYDVQIPYDASGTHTFGPGEWMMEGMSNSEPIYCDTVVTVCNNPPVPEITQPLNGAKVNSTITVEAVDHSGEDDIAYCLFEYIGSSGVIFNDTDQSDGWSCYWDTTTVLKDGNYTIRATMVDATGQSGTDEVTVRVEIEDELCGDLNHDGTLTPADATIALQLAATGGWDANADVNHDSRITSLDALMILQAVAGAIEL